MVVLPTPPFPPKRISRRCLFCKNSGTRWVIRLRRHLAFGRHSVVIWPVAVIQLSFGCAVIWPSAVIQLSLGFAVIRLSLGFAVIWPSAVIQLSFGCHCAPPTASCPPPTAYRPWTLDVGLTRHSVVNLQYSISKGGDNDPVRRNNKKWPNPLTFYARFT